ncbi:MAG: hypothetical protein UHY58_07500 [Alistipes sp.]|nr:hypothetical protein [Alistipes sp.]
MKSEHSFSGHFASALIIFALAAVISILLLFTALIVWLSGLIGSLELAILGIGVLLCVVAAVIYTFTLKDAFRQIGYRMETIYEVAETAQRGYLWLEGLLKGWLEGRK